ncbi:glycosyltransferase [Denitromonas iodatirespirans]|uniref:Glycosyltransferase n=1 Tax=Denitromonas iodatirespirans TaxID=2795389 RepID=A0A944H8W0_DENI1|nr:glycosyltransferase [Denitromonas iodatirespirans]MBT0961795.1 glycosyltransferase [Denitromonas iodatirespirans]
MKVLHVEAGRHLYGGAKQVLYILQGLAARGVTNVLACPSGAHIAAEARALAEVVEMPMGGDADLGLVLRLKQTIHTHRPDIVHIHSRRGADLWGGIAAKLAGVPCVLSRRVDNPEARWAVALKYRLFEHVITISEGIRQVLLAEGLAPEKVSCVRSAVDPAPYLHEVDKAAFRADLGFAADTPIAGMVAQLIPRKGHRHLLAALPAVLAEHPRLQVLIYGRGPLEAELRQAVADLGFAGHVTLMGFVDDLPAQLGGLDLLVHPADMEGLGVSLLQASAARVPIIASRAGGMPEAVVDGENGVLIEVGNVTALTAAMKRLLGDAALRARMGEAGRARVLSEFSVDAMCEGNLAIYHKVLAR